MRLGLTRDIDTYIQKEGLTPSASSGWAFRLEKSENGSRFRPEKKNQIIIIIFNETSVG